MKTASFVSTAIQTGAGNNVITCLRQSKQLNQLMSKWVNECCLTPNSFFACIAWQEQATFHEMMTMSALYLTNTPSWIFIVHAHGNKSPRVEKWPHSDILTWFRANHYLLLLPNTAFLGEATNINFMHFYLTRPGLKSTIYCSLGEHTNRYTTDAVPINEIYPIIDRRI